MDPNWEAQADRLALRALARGDGTGWFEELYAAAAREEVAMPWDRLEPHWALVEWTANQGDCPLDSARAVVVGCGLGADAAHLARIGYATVGFDLSPTAIATARERFPLPGLEFSVQDVLALPAEWSRGFDLVVEIHTAQAIPTDLRVRAMPAIAGLVADGGTLVAIANGREDDAPDPDGPPWPLTREQIEGFATGGLELLSADRVHVPDQAGDWRWRAVLMRVASHSFL